MMSYNINQTRKVLDHDAIRRLAPSVFATQAHADVTDKYRFIPTFEMLETLESQGWQCVQAGEHSIRKLSKKGFQKHMLRFRNPNLPKIADSEIDLVTFNSHDRTTAYKFVAGVFRPVCANGLMVGTELFEPITVKHVGYKADNVIEAAYRLIDTVPRIAETIQGFQSVELNLEEKLAFANAALVAKLGEATEDRPQELNPAILLRPRRSEDQKNDLWSTLNVVQENLIRGGQRTVNLQRTRRMTTRPVASISENARLNQALWTLAESLKQHKAA
jgi:hypothetical protein